jgi:hypothetical protein
MQRSLLLICGYFTKSQLGPRLIPSVRYTQMDSASIDVIVVRRIEGWGTTAGRKLCIEATIYAGR